MRQSSTIQTAARNTGLSREKGSRQSRRWSPSSNPSLRLSAIPIVANSILQNAGQTCSAGSRLLVERKAHDALVEKLIARAKGMKIGPGVSDPDMGPIISKRQLEMIEEGAPRPEWKRLPAS